MAELFAFGGQRPFQPQQNVEWYSSGASAYGPASYSSYGPASTSGHGAAAAYGSFEDEPPLLEELGIDIPAIASRTRSILTLRLSGHDLDSLDLGGPLIFMALLGLSHLLVAKLHFGYILGWTAVGSALIWLVLKGLAGHDDPDAKALDLYSCTCLLGYSLLPLVVHSLASLLLPRRSPFSVAGAVLAVLWSAHTAARLFTRRSPLLDGQYLIIAYPCALMYCAFALLTLY